MPVRSVHIFIISIILQGSIAVFTDCGGLYKYEKIEVTNCDNTGPCHLIRGRNATMKMTFKSDLVISKVNAKVYGVISGLLIPFPLPNPDGCRDSGLTCPLQKGTEYTYTVTIPVKKLYPQIVLKIKWEMYGDNKLLLCSLFDAYLT